MSVAQRQDLSTSKQRLLQSIARLDEQQEAGMIAESAYQQRRQADKTRLLAIEQQLQRESVQDGSAGTPHNEGHRSQQKRKRRG